MQVAALLEFAQAARRTGSNSINERSSRSHALLQLVLRGPSGAAHGKFTLVDLAGSERAADTMEARADSRAEGATINQSLLSLKVKALMPSDPFRSLPMPPDPSRSLPMPPDAFPDASRCLSDASRCPSDASRCPS